MRVVVALMVCLPVLAPAPLVAQGDRPAPYVGVTAGLEAIPAAYANQCGWLREQNPSSASGGRITLGRGFSPGLAVETQLAYSRFPETTCLAIAPTYPDGVHTDSYRRSDDDQGLVASDFRLRYQPYDPWVFTGGAGWVWNHANPYLAGSIGWRVGRRLRAAIDAEIMGHRIAVDALTREWRNGEIVRVISEQRGHRWDMGAAVRVGLELRLD